MNKIVFSTDEQYTRPIITLYEQQALIDSGSVNALNFGWEHFYTTKDNAGFFAIFSTCIVTFCVNTNILNPDPPGCFRHYAIDTNEQRMDTGLPGFLKSLFQAFFSVLYIYL